MKTEASAYLKIVDRLKQVGITLPAAPQRTEVQLLAKAAGILANSAANIVAHISRDRKTPVKEKLQLANDAIELAQACDVLFDRVRVLMTPVAAAKPEASEGICPRDGAPCASAGAGTTCCAEGKHRLKP